MTNILYLSYNGLLEPILSSQVIPYLKELARRDFHFTLLTYEKKRDLRRAGRKRVETLKDELKSFGIEWRFLRYHKKPAALSTIFDILIGAFCCIYLIPKRKIKIVHIRGITPGSMVLFLPKIFKLKMLFDMRGRLAEEMSAGGLWREWGILFKVIKMCERGLLKKADAVAVLTKKHLKLNRELDYLKDRDIPMDVIPCCVDMNKFYYEDGDSGNFKKALGLEGKFVVMYPGKLGTFYFIGEMLDFFKVTLAAVPEAVFFVLTTDEPEGLINMAESKGIRGDKVRVEKDVPFELIPKYMRIADAGLFFINPYNKLGSSPIKLGEFLASGVPVIINPGVGDSDDIVRENGAGVIVTGFNEAAYMKAVNELLRLKEDGEVLRKRCRDAAGKCLSLADGVDRYYKIYKAIS